MVGTSHNTTVIHDCITAVTSLLFMFSAHPPDDTGVVALVHNLDNHDIDGAGHLWAVLQLRQTVVQQHSDQVVEQVLQGVLGGLLGQGRALE